MDNDPTPQHKKIPRCQPCTNILPGPCFGSPWRDLWKTGVSSYGYSASLNHAIMDPSRKAQNGSSTRLIQSRQGGHEFREWVG
ncbi:hypothetical protein BV898_19598 [Hypsibius exemplaris]|uniref:Uncharacterized protein n=1 Tax=Hypsibius exemplaris TaxID=2072580 RepID=A0A9X6NJI3_HYPEX|nr:hypothetical protein BV898_19598 [Hypsibius exemplaris]